MDIPAVISSFLAVMQQVQPGVEATLKVGTAVGTAGTTLVTVLQKGKQLITFFARKDKTRKTRKSKPAKGDVVPYNYGEPIATKKEVAIVVDISRRSLRDVEKFLVANNLDADLILVTNDPTYEPQVKQLNDSDPQVWVEIVREFNIAMNAIKHEIGSVNIHIFISAPVAIAFGMGAVWGTVDRATVYHWNQVEYKRVLDITRDLRFS